ncbi:autotransporter outer membrane beta-barrel domain-containing protein [Bartonella choladocola]|uniref:Autotransporter beta-domain-containing protein n=1 Tax=Bartonella choladocola TaxID=2750995 RepID=A0A1U9MJP9_9HYPH|nr:autotransporter outer membrane beta-barrel domain-containing protein [Bartonella choladocola]AQT48145.1 Autotransporter beta-domain-containing protein [Bartonella choladocola]
MINNYVTVKVSTFTLMLCLSLSTSSSAYAEDIVYNGTSEDATTKLRRDPASLRYSLYPAKSSSNNTITVSNDSNLSFDENDETPYVSPYNVIGGLIRNGDGDASNNKVILNGGKIENHVYGGRVDGTGNADNNYIHVKDITLSGNFYGGITMSGTANGNRIVLESGKFVARIQIYSGFSMGSGDANNNSIIIHSADIENSVINAAFAGDGNAWGNHVNIASKGSIKTKVGQVVSGYVYRSGDSLATATSAKGNSVTIEENTEVTGEVYGAHIQYGVGTAGGTNEDDGNRVTITGATVGGSIYGGVANGAALNNVVTITQSTVKDSIFGGSSESVGAASFNKVFLTGGRTVDVFAGFSTLGEASNNSAVITDATVNGVIYGGMASTNAINNTVALRGGIAEKSVTGGFSSLGDATENKVIVSAKSSAQSVIGGQSQNGGAIANNVAIEDATITGDVFGGISSGSSATKNIVTLMGESVKISGSVYGGYDAAASSNDVFTGNTLNLNEFRGSMAGIYNFEKYNWVLPKDVVNNDALVHITGTNPVDLAKTSHTVSLLNDGNRLHVNDKITLIDKSKNGPDVPSLEVHQGNFIIYDMKLQQENDGYVLTAVNMTDMTDTGSNGGDNPGNELAGRINPRSKAFSEGRVASLGFLNQAADLIANSGIRSAKAAVLEGADKAWNMNLMPFFVIDGSSNRYKTGSHADVDGFNMAVGLASGFEIANKHAVTLGAFFEYGRGTYDTYNSFATYASVHGDGDTHYTGGGILGRIDFAGTGLGLVDKLEAGQADGLYAEASFRAGHIDTDFDTNDILGITGGSSKYDSGADYYGLHGGVGYVMNFDERNSVDVYARYLWTKIDSETVTIGVDKLRFDDADSSRIRIGARYTMAYNQQFKPFVGVAYDHEFDGKIGAYAYQLKLDKPSLEGDTGIFEAGVSMTPISTIKALSVDISGQGYIGKRQGGGGGLKIKYQF